jgi:hypothetical protein
MEGQLQLDLILLFGNEAIRPPDQHREKAITDEGKKVKKKSLTHYLPIIGKSISTSTLFHLKELKLSVDKVIRRPALAGKYRENVSQQHACGRVSQS